MQPPVAAPTKDISYWENLGRGSNGEGTMYQMGDNVVRSYLLEQMVAKGVQSLLDVGCGSGPIYELIRTKNLPIQYTGSDYALSFIEHNRTAFPEGRWIHEDARSMSHVAESSVDCVLFLHSLDSIDRFQDAIKEAARVTKQHVVIVLWRTFQENGIHNVHTDEHWGDTHLSEFDQKGLEDVFKDAGLMIEDQRVMMNGGQYNYIYWLNKFEKV